MKNQNNQKVDLQIAGMDPSMLNWGISRGILSLDLQNLKNSQLRITDLKVTRPVKPDKKQVRTASIDLIAAKQLADGVISAVDGVQLIFAEMPVGSQNASGMKAYGICTGIMGALQSKGLRFYEVTPQEVKMATVGKKTATKEDMINWARHQHPEAPWPTYKEKGEVLLSASLAEHMADAIASIYAGLRTKEFQQTLEVIRLQANQINQG